jgi:hypothetical protein
MELHLTDLSLAEFYSLETGLGAANIKRLDQKGAVNGYGILDPITATVIISGASIGALAIWISKNREKITIEKDEVIPNADGSSKVRHDSTTMDRESSDAKVVEQIRKFLDLDNLAADVPKS